MVTLINDQTNFVFLSDYTYYVSNAITLHGTTTIEGGAVLKFAPDYSIGITIDGTNLICPVDPKKPAIFTAKDDDSIGAIIPGSNGTPTNYYNGGAPDLIESGYPPFGYSYGAGIQLLAGASFNLSNLKFYYLDNPIIAESCELFLTNIQAFNCAGVVYSDTADVSFYNCLFANDGKVWQGGDTIIIAEHVTVDNCAWFGAPGDGGGSSLSATNCLVINVPYATIDLDYETNHTSTLSSDSGVFNSSGLDYYYLATSSAYRNVGTTNIDSGLLSAIRTMTTFAPQDGSGTDTNTPDLGFHYPIP